VSALGDIERTKREHRHEEDLVQKKQRQRCAHIDLSLIARALLTRVCPMV